MLCPFRKEYVFMDNEGDEDFAVKSTEAYFLSCDFLDCYEEQCMMWDKIHNNCGLKNKE